MRSRLNFLLRLTLCFAVLFFLQDWLALGYRSLLNALSPLVLPAGAQPFDCGETCSLRLVAYLSLVLCSTEVGFLRRGVVLLVGLAVFVGIDLAGLYLWPTPRYLAVHSGETFYQLLCTFVWNLLRELLLPLLLWVVAFDSHLGLFFPASDMSVLLEGERVLPGN